MIEGLRNNIQYSQIWLQLDAPQKSLSYLNNTQDRLWKIESILMNTNDEQQSITLKMKQSIFEHIGG
jgi:hypothetical protein